MSNIIYHRDTCRVCNSKDLKMVFSLKPSPIGDAYVMEDTVHIPQESYPIDLFLCNNCGLAQILDVINPNILYGDYLYVTGSSLGLTEHFEDYAKNVIDLCKLKGRSFVVDVGSNDGILLQSFKKRGMNILGVEPAVHIADFANNYGIRTIAHYFTPEIAKKIREEHGQAKLITSNNVLGNIDNLQSWVEAIDILLASDGVYVFESFYLGDLIKNMVFEVLYHEHLSSFSVKPVKYLFEHADFELIAVERIKTKGGSLRYYIQRRGGPLPKNDSVDKLLEEEIHKGIYAKQTYVDFQDKVEKNKIQLLEFLTHAKNEDKSIIGFGASITSTTLIYHFEIGIFLDYLVDENPTKQGLFSPGLHIPVFSPKMMYEKKPDYALILAWRYAEPIIKKNQDFIKSGGKFIIPLPELRIIRSS